MQMFLTPEENIIEQLRTENAALKEQMAHIKEIEFPTKCIAIADIWKNKVTLLDETIAQQAEAIRLKNAALTVAEDFVDRHSEKWYASGQRDLQQIREAMRIQPSPEILQARDKRVAEACAKVCIEQAEGIARSTPVSRDRVHTMFKGIARPAPVRDCSESSVRESAFRIRNGAWERHL